MDPLQTAAAIARVRRTEGSRPVADRLFDDPYAGLFEDARLDAQQIFDLVPSFVDHIRLRTRYFDDLVRDAVARGARNLVLLGAGFDTRALRMPELQTGVRVIEVDHEDQIADKKRIFASARIVLPSHLSFAAADVSEEGALARGLAAAGLTTPANVLWLCEGLFGYLSLPAIAALARDTARLSAPGSVLVANHHEFAWTFASLALAFTPAGWSAERGASAVEMHRAWIGGETPADVAEFLFFVATRTGT